MNRARLDARIQCVVNGEEKYDVAAEETQNGMIFQGSRVYLNFVDTKTPFNKLCDMVGPNFKMNIVKAVGYKMLNIWEENPKIFNDLIYEKSYSWWPVFESDDVDDMNLRFTDLMSHFGKKYDLKIVLGSECDWLGTPSLFSSCDFFPDIDKIVNMKDFKFVFLIQPTVLSNSRLIGKI